MGDSYVCRGLERARETMGTNLGLSAHLNWFGRGGMQWRALIPFFPKSTFEEEQFQIHCGGNDLGRLRSLVFVSAMKQDLHDFNQQFTQRRTVLSAISRPGGSSGAVSESAYTDGEHPWGRA
ncbi:hypothetical protein SRHO_G00235740 [Serrasalmus rhombeus]